MRQYIPLIQIIVLFIIASLPDNCFGQGVTLNIKELRIDTTYGNLHIKKGKRFVIRKAIAIDTVISSDSSIYISSGPILYRRVDKPYFEESPTWKWEIFNQEKYYFYFTPQYTITRK